MGKYSKIILLLFLFSHIVSLAIHLLMEGMTSYIGISIIMLTSIYAGSFLSVLFVLKKFKRLSSKHIGFRFFTILFTVSLVIFVSISCFMGIFVTVYFKDGMTDEQVRRVYFDTGIMTFMPIKMFIGTFIGMLLSVTTTDIKVETNEIK